MQIWSVGRILFADRAFILFADRVFILLLFADADRAAKPHLLHTRAGYKWSAGGRGRKKKWRRDESFSQLFKWLL